MAGHPEWVDAPLGFSEAWAIMFAKDRVPRQDVPLGFDAGAQELLCGAVTTVDQVGNVVD